MKDCAQVQALEYFEATIFYVLRSSGNFLLDWMFSVIEVIEKKGKGYKVSDLRITNLIEVDLISILKLLQGRC